MTPPMPPDAPARTVRQAEPVRLMTLDEAAALLNRHPKTLRRTLLAVMELRPGLHVTRMGRSIMFTPEQYDATVKALAWHSQYVSAARSGTRAGPSASVKKPSSSPSSAQERLRARMPSASRTGKPGVSKTKRLTVLQGGRGA